jgi:hypothetical protein
MRHLTPNKTPNRNVKMRHLTPNTREIGDFEASIPRSYNT